MKKILLLLLCLFPSALFAEDVTVNWVPPNTTVHIDGYKLYQSDDQGQTWQEIADVNATVTSYVVHNVPENHLILWRAASYNSQQEAVRTNAGAWYNGLWTVPEKPKGAGSEVE